MTALAFREAETILNAALADAGSVGAKPLCLVVLDAGGHALALKRQDAASFFRVEIAIAKAHGALGMGMGTRTLAERVGTSPMLFTSLAAATGGRVVPAAGGVLIRDDAGGILGAVGVSGDAPDINEASAVAGIRAAQLAADPGGQASA